MSKQLEALMFVADGSDALNVCMTRTILDRAGVKTTLALVRSPTDAQEHRGVKLAAVLHGRGQSDDLESAFTVFADVPVEACGIDDAEKYDLLVFPGGLKGSSTLAADSRVVELAKRHYEQGKLTGMICAGVRVAKAAGIHHGQALTAHPFVKQEFVEDYDFREDTVVISKNLITSRAPGTTFPFAFALLDQLVGKEKREAIRIPMMGPDPAS